MPRTLLPLLLAASSLAACTAAPVSPVTAPSSEVTPAAATAPATTQRSRPRVPVTATVTEAQLGRLSTIVVVTNAGEKDPPATGLASSLEVITRDGTRHPVWSVGLTEEDGYYPGDFVLADWRPDLHTALLLVQRGGPVPDRAVAYDVTTGETHAITLPRKVYNVGLDPDGTGLLMALYAKGPAGRLVTRAWDGTITRLPATTGGGPITSPDGRTLVTPSGDRPTWWVVGLTRDTSRELEPPGSCDPVRWIDPDTVLAGCYAHGGNRLRAVDLDGGSRPLGPFHRIDDAGKVDVIADGDVRPAGGRRWFATLRGRGSSLLTEQDRTGARTRVGGTSGLVHLAPAGGGRLLLARSTSLLERQTIRAVLEVLDPATGARQELLRLERGEAWRSVIGATEVRSWHP